LFDNIKGYQETIRNYEEEKEYNRKKELEEQEY
jgi:hypothetical protein